MTRKLIDGDFTATHTLQIYHEHVGVASGYCAILQNKATGEQTQVSAGGDKKEVQAEGRRALKESTIAANAEIESKYSARALVLAEQGLDSQGKEWFEQTFYHAKVEEAYATHGTQFYMVVLKTASEDGTDVVCTITDISDKKEAEAIAELYRKNGPTMLALLQATVMFPEPSDEWPDSSDIAQMAEEEARNKARTPIEVLADACGLALDVLVPEQCMTVGIGDKVFHVTMEEVPAKPVLQFDSYAAWNAAVQERGLSLAIFPRGNVSAYVGGQEVGWFLAKEEHEGIPEVAVLFNTPLEFQVWQDLRRSL